MAFGAKVKITVDRSAAAKKQFVDQINDLASDVKIKKFTVDPDGVSRLVKSIEDGLDKKPIKMPTLDCSAAVADFQKKLQNVINSLSIKNGVTIQLGDTGIGKVATEIKEVENAAKKGQGATNQFRAAMEVLDTTMASLKKSFKSATMGKDILSDAKDVNKVTSDYTALVTEVRKLKELGDAGSIERAQQLLAEARAIDSYITSVKGREAAESKAASSAVASEKQRYNALKQCESLIAQISNAQRKYASSGLIDSGDFRVLEEYRTALLGLLKSFNTEDSKMSLATFLDEVSKKAYEFANAINKLSGAEAGSSELAEIAEAVAKLNKEMRSSSSALSKYEGMLTRVTSGQRAYMDALGAGAKKDTWHGELQKVVIELQNATDEFRKTGDLDTYNTKLAQIEPTLKRLLRTNGQYIASLKQKTEQEKATADAAKAAAAQQEVAQNSATKAEKNRLTNLNRLQEEIKSNEALLKKLQTAMTKSGTTDSQYSTAASNLQARINELKVLVSILQDPGTAFHSDTFKILEAQVKGKEGYVGLTAAVREYITELNKKAAAEASGAASTKAAAVTTKEQSDIFRQIIQLQAQIRYSQSKWGAAELGVSALDYNKLAGYVSTLDNLKATAPKTKAELQELKNELAKVTAQFRESSANIQAAGENTNTLGQRFTNLSQKFGMWFSASQVFMQTVQSIKQMVNTVIDLDTAMTELRKVTDETEAAYDSFFNKAISRAKELGVTITDTISATADFARLGYDVDDAAGLADAALVYKNVGDGIEDVSEASESIISTMKAFGIEAANAMTIVDKFNEVNKPASHRSNALAFRKD